MVSIPMGPERQSAYRAHRNSVKKLKGMKSRLAKMNPMQKEYGLRNALVMLAQADADKLANDWKQVKNNHKSKSKRHVGRNVM
jgi:hypothetical protein